MRVTQNMLDRFLLGRMQDNLGRLADLNEKLTTGQRINTVSDDVPAAREVMERERENGLHETFLANIDSLRGGLSFATSSLEQASGSLSRIKELAIQAATDTYSHANRQVMADEVEQILNTIISLANGEVKGDHVFGGEGADAAPFRVQTDASGEVQSVTYEGEAISTQVPVGPDTTAESNFVGAEVFQGGGDLFETIIRLRDAIRASDTDEIENQIGNLDSASQGVRESLGILGERMGQLDAFRSSLERFVALNDEAISKRQDADVAELMVDYNSQMALYQVVLQAAAQSIRPSLLNFL